MSPDSSGAAPPARVAATSRPVAVEVIGEGFAGWTPELRAEFAANRDNVRVGGRLLSETDRVKVWEIRLAPGERMPAHRHVLDYFWTVLTDGVSIQHADDGTTTRVTYRAGETRHLSFGEGEYLLHDLNNAGTTDLVFVTVEHRRRPAAAAARAA